MESPGFIAALGDAIEAYRSFVGADADHLAAHARGPRDRGGAADRRQSPDTRVMQPDVPERVADLRRLDGHRRVGRGADARRAGCDGPVVEADDVVGLDVEVDRRPADFAGPTIVS